MSTLSRADLWTKEYWDGLDSAVREQANQVRVAQKVFPSKVIANAESVVDETIIIPAAPPAGPAAPAMAAAAGAPAIGRASTLSFAESQNRPIVEIAVEFTLRHAEVDNEPTKMHGRQLAVEGARFVAQAEDRILFRGQRALPTLAALNVSFRYPSPIVPGMLDLDGTPRTAQIPGAAAALTAAAVSAAPATPPSSERILAAFTAAVADLNGRAHTKPYGFIVHTDIWALANSPTPATLNTPAQIIREMLDRGFYMSEGIDRDLKKKTGAGLLVSVPDQAPIIYYAMEPTVVPTQIDRDGFYHFQVKERFQYVIRDPLAFRTIVFDVST